jgi:Flp pilus assembly pilin Flp
VSVTVHLFALKAIYALDARVRNALIDRQRGQATTEYVLVLLGAAAIAVAVVAWATRSGKVGELLDRVFDHVAGEIS